VSVLQPSDVTGAVITGEPRDVDKLEPSLNVLFANFLQSSPQFIVHSHLSMPG